MTCSLPAYPVCGTTTLMRERDNIQLVDSEPVDHAIGKAAKRKAARLAAPDWTKMWMITEHRESALELGNERKPEIGTSVLCVIVGSVDQFTLSFDAERGDHFNAVRARAIDSDAGITAERPLSIAATRRSTSTAHASSTSESSKRLSSSRWASSARSSGLSFRASASTDSSWLGISILLCDSVKEMILDTGKDANCVPNVEGNRRAALTLARKKA